MKLDTIVRQTLPATLALASRCFNSPYDFKLMLFNLIPRRFLFSRTAQQCIHKGRWTPPARGKQRPRVLAQAFPLEIALQESELFDPENVRFYLKKRSRGKEETSPDARTVYTDAEGSTTRNAERDPGITSIDQERGGAGSVPIPDQLAVVSVLDQERPGTIEWTGKRKGWPHHCAAHEEPDPEPDPAELELLLLLLAAVASVVCTACKIALSASFRPALNCRL